jgi:hypothetical protein
MATTWSSFTMSAAFSCRARGHGQAGPANDPHDQADQSTRACWHTRFASRHALTQNRRAVLFSFTSRERTLLCCCCIFLTVLSAQYKPGARPLCGADKLIPCIFCAPFIHLQSSPELLDSRSRVASCACGTAAVECHTRTVVPPCVPPEYTDHGPVIFRL